MTDVRRMLNDAEREAHDQIFYEANRRPDGTRRRSSEIAPELLRLLRDAEQAGHQWATWVIDDALTEGLRKAAQKWAGTKEVIETALGQRLVSKPAAYGIRRTTASGKTEQLRLGWDEMTEDDLDQLIASRGAQITAEKDTIDIARRLRELIRKTGKSPVSEALRSLGMTMEQYLATEAVA